MLILPTIYRPDSLRRFVTAYEATGGTIPVWVVFNEDNAFQYADVKTPAHWKRCKVSRVSQLGDIFTAMFRSFPDEPYYGMVADDVVPETQGWDVILRDSCQHDKIAWGWDGIQNEKLPVHPFIGGDLVRRLGYWSAPGIKHWYVDNAWKDIADKLNCGVYLPEVRMKHVHYANGLAQVDRAYNNQPSQSVDEGAYNLWRERDLPLVK